MDSWFNRSDIEFNFLVSGDGAIYVGRGWENEGEHTERFNNKSIGIGFIGIFFDEPPPKKQLIAAKAIMADGVKQEKLTVDYKLYGQCQLIRRRSPGKALYKIIIKWKHWSTSPSTDYCY